MPLFVSYPFLITFLITFGLSLLLTRAMIIFNISDIPGDRSSHIQPTPRAGGLAVVISFFVGAGLYSSLFPPPHGFSWELLALVSGVLFLGAGVSFIDDISHVPYRIRLLVQSLIAMVLVSVDLKIECFVLEGYSILPLVEFFLTLLFIIFITNAANFVDGLNGLLSGSVMVALPFMVGTTILLPSSVFADYWINVICLTLFPSILGFYIFNFPKGRIFLGDVGSVFIGLMIGIIALMGQKGQAEQPTWLFINARLFLLIYPLGFIWFDPVFTVARRLLLGRSMFEPNRDFLLHLLNRAGYSHTHVSGLYYVSVVILGTMALLTPLGYLSFVGLVIGYVFLQIAFVFWVFFQGKRAGIKI